MKVNDHRKGNKMGKGRAKTQLLNMNGREEREGKSRKGGRWRFKCG